MLAAAETRSSLFLASRLVFAEVPRFEPEGLRASLSPVSSQLARTRRDAILTASAARDPADEVALRDIERRMQLVATGVCDERPAMTGGGQEMRALGANESMGAGISTVDVALDTVKRGVGEVGNYLAARMEANNEQLRQFQADAHSALDRTLTRDERRAASYRVTDGMMKNMPLVGATQVFGKVAGGRILTGGDVARTTVAHWLGPQGVRRAEKVVPPQAIRPVAEGVMERLSPPVQELAKWMATGMKRIDQYAREMQSGLSGVGRISEIERDLLDMAREFAGRLETLRMHAQRPEMAYLQGDLVRLRQAVGTYEGALGTSWSTLKDMSATFKRS